MVKSYDSYVTTNLSKLPIRLKPKIYHFLEKIRSIFVTILKFFKASKTNRGAGLKMLWMLVIIGNITIDRFAQGSEGRPFCPSSSSHMNRELYW